LAKQVEHVDEHPVLGEPVTFAAPEVQAVHAQASTGWRTAQVSAKVGRPDAMPTRRGRVIPFGEQAVQRLHGAVWKGMQPVALVQIFEFFLAETGADPTRAIPAYVGVKVIGDAHAFQVFLIIDVEGVEDESSDQIEREV